LENWDGYASNAMRAFRECSLQYRAWPYFKYLLKIFRNPSDYPFFDRYWKLVTSLEQDKEANFDQFCYRHHTFGPVRYISSTTVAVTSFGNLFLVKNLPLDEHTEQVFNQLKVEAGFGVVRLAPWPEKQMP
jgi:hypothetical protein